jgi:small-conductance mechanosensitive channel
MWMLELLGPDVDLTRVAAAGLAVVLVAYAVAEVAARVTRAALVASAVGKRAADLRRPIVRRPIRLVRLTVFVVVAATLVSPALELAGVGTPFGLSSEGLVDWFVRSGVRVLVIALLAWVITRIVAAAVLRLEEELGHDAPGDVEANERLKRANTLGRLLQNAVNVLVGAIATLMILRELNIDILPILTGAGVVGLAVGFGAQTLVKDLIAGFFLMLEDQVRVGDVAQINGTGGLVEAIRLRTIVLRDMTGAVHVFPNGSITTLSNLSKDYSFAVLDLGVAYKEDTDHVVDVLREVAEALRADEALGTDILEPLEVLGVDAFADSQVTIKVRLKTLPQRQWAVCREFRRRIKKAFDAAGIEIPFPHVSVYFGEASKPFATKPE